VQIDVVELIRGAIEEIDQALDLSMHGITLVEILGHV
jgi:hypothetical protein